MAAGLLATLCLCIGIVPVLGGPSSAASPAGTSADEAARTDGVLSGGGVASTTLVEEPKRWDGRVVVFVGEAIGDRMVRGKMAWLHLNDDVYQSLNVEEGAALGGYNSGQAIWVSSELAAKVRYFGDYRHEGDIVRVEGEFNRACVEHGGDMDIHASSLEVVRQGHAIRHRLEGKRIFSGILLWVAAGVLLGLRRRAQRQRI